MPAYGDFLIMGCVANVILAVQVSGFCSVPARPNGNYRPSRMIIFSVVIKGRYIRRLEMQFHVKWRKLLREQ